MERCKNWMVTPIINRWYTGKPLILGGLTRVAVLFAVGIFFTVVQRLLIVQRTSLSKSDSAQNLQNILCGEDGWWVSPLIGAAAAVVGVLCPSIDKKLGDLNHRSKEWSDIIRCVAVYVGITHAGAKLDFQNNFQCTMTLAALSIGLWWLCDRSRSGLGLGVAMAVIATCVAQVLMYYGIWKFSESDIPYLQSWLPCVFFSGGVTVGNIGRQLALEEDALIEPTCRSTIKKCHTS